MKQFVLSLLLPFFTVCLNQLQAQPLEIQHLPPTDELAQEFIRDFAQDSLGFIWIGTAKGLVKYDGNNYTSYHHQPFDSNSLIRNYVPALFVDRYDPYLWIGTDDGLSRLHLETDAYTNYRHEPQNPNRLDANDLLGITQDEKGNIWVGTAGDSIARLDTLSGKFQYFPVACGDPDVGFTRDIFLGKDGWLWYSTGPYLERRHPESGETELFRLDIGLVLEGFNSSCQDKNGDIWTLTDRGIFRYDFDRMEFVQHPFRPEVFNRKFGVEWNELKVNGFLADSQGRIWIGSEVLFGVFLIDAAGEITRIKEDKSTAKPFSHLWSTFEDSQGNVWLGYWQGYDIVYPLSDKFRTLQIKDSTGEHPRVSNVFSVAVDDQQRIYAGYMSPGMLRYDPAKGKSDLYFHHPEEPLSIPPRWASTLIYQGGKIWVQTFQGPRRLFDPATQRFYPIPQSAREKAAIDLSTPGELFASGNGRLWFPVYEGDQPGLYLYETSSQAIVDTVPLPPAQRQIKRLLEDRNKLLWLGTEGSGLYRWDPVHLVYDSFPHNPDDPQSLPGNSITGLAQDTLGNLWVALYDGGLNQLANPGGDPEHVQIRNFSTANSALPVNSITDIIADDLGNIWLATNKGLSRFDPLTQQFSNFGLNENLQNLKESRFCKLPDGTIYVGGKLGVTVFNPEKFRFNSVPPQVRLTGFWIFNRPVPVRGQESGDLGFVSPLEKTITYTEKIELPYWQNDLTFEFAALNYIYPEKNSYQFRLDGVDQNWKLTSADNRRANYPGLRPGRYTLQIRAANNDGQWNATPTSIQLIIRPPWWLTWWAFALYIICTLALIAFVWRYELNRRLVRAKAQQQEAINQLQTKLYTNITHEFRTPLTIILGMVDQLENQVSEHAGAGLRIVGRNARQLLKLVNQMLDLSKLESGSMTLELIQSDIIDYLRYLLESFHAYAGSKGIRLHFISDLDAFSMDYDPDRLLHVVSNLLSNAIKFSPEETDVYLSVEAIADGDQLQIQVKDAGIGIPRNKIPHVFDRFYQVDDSSTRAGEGAGIGLTITKELLILMGGEIRVESPAPGMGGKGSAFTATLPVTRHQEVSRTRPETIVRPASETDFSSTEVLVPPTGKPEAPMLLIVEDNPDLIKFLVSSLHRDYQVKIARNGQQGIDQALKLIPDLIITDVMMPVQDGYTLCHTLKNDMRTNHIPIIMLTAKADQSSRIGGLKTGADAYLAKPFDIEELNVRLKKLIELRKKLQAKYGALSLVSAGDQEYLSPDERFVVKLQTIIQDQLGDENFGIEPLCNAMGISRMQLHRKLVALTGTSASHYIRNIRLEKARELLRSTDHSVSEIAYRVGFRSASHFTRTFTEKFGHPPSEIR